MEDDLLDFNTLADPFAASGMGMTVMLILCVLARHDVALLRCLFFNFLEEVSFSTNMRALSLIPRRAGCDKYY